MRFSEALETVSTFYIPGAVSYYNRMRPDPWQQAHDALENLVGVADEEQMSNACAEFVDCLRGLIERFKKEAGQSQHVSPHDAFVIGDTKRVKQWQSVKYRECAGCSKKDDLVVMGIPGSDTGVQIVCRTCKQKGAA